MRRGIIVAWAIYVATPAAGRAADFDVKTLAQLGYSADIAEFFTTPRFLPGVHRVMLEVNAAQRYQEEVRFDADGEPCLSAQLAETLRLRPAQLAAGCERITARWPQAQVRMFPGAYRLELTLPEEAFDPEKQRGELRGGYAALMNYNLYGSRLRGRYGDRQTLQAMLEPGVNVSNWVIRNRSLYNRDESGGRLEVYETSAARDFPQWAARLQAGEFGAGGALSGGLPVTGVQWASANMRTAQATLAVPLRGSVSSQATLEVKQRGLVVYRTLLPAGPFALDSLGPAMAGVETEVVITDGEGRKQHFSVTPGAGEQMDGQDGYLFALGRYRAYGRQPGSDVPALLMGEKTVALSARQQLGLGGVMTEGYQRLAWQGSGSDAAGNWLTGGAAFSRGRQRGWQLDAQGQLALWKGLSAALSSQYRTADYLEADEALSAGREGAEDSPTSRLRFANSASLSWGAPRWGAFTYSLSHERYYHGSPAWMHALSYGKSVRSATWTLSLQSSAQDRLALYAGVSLPLGGGSLSSRLQLRRNSQMTLGSSWQGPVGERLQGYLDVARDGGGEYQAGGNLSGSTAYSRLALGATRSGSGNTSLSLASSGTLGVANGTWVTAPQAAGDTLVLVKVPGQAGVAVSGAGNGITDFAGDALLPAAAPYLPVQARIETLSLPLNLRLDSTGAELKLARGTVAERFFRVTEVRQLLLTLRDEVGNLLPTGASVHDEQGQLMGTLIGAGNVMLVNEDIGKVLRVRRVNMNECRVSYETPAVFDPSALYEEREGICREAVGLQTTGENDGQEDEHPTGGRGPAARRTGAAG